MAATDRSRRGRRTGLALVGMLGVVLLTQGCGGTEAWNGESAVTPHTGTRVPTPVAPAALTSVIPNATAFGTGWENDGYNGPSADIDNPPKECAPFVGVYRRRLGTALQEYTYLPTSNGYESGHAALSVVGLRSNAEVQRELALVKAPAYRPCAEAIAVRWFANTEDGRIDNVDARFVAPDVVAHTGLWRVAIRYHVSRYTPMFYLDIAFLGSGTTLAKLRVARCGCLPPLTGPTEVLPGEHAALSTIAAGLAHKKANA